MSNKSRDDFSEEDMSLLDQAAVMIEKDDPGELQKIYSTAEFSVPDRIRRFSPFRGEVILT